MKKLVISLIIVLITTTTLLAQTQVKRNEGPDNNAQNKPNSEVVTYRLFPTQNIWTFIKSNTRNGQLWQVQFDIKENNRLETNLSLLPLVSKEQEKNGRFTLYPTQNIYTFILLDQLDGRVWQVQWSTEVEKRLIIPIE